MNIIDATKKYEAWLGSQIPLIESDIELKHKKMRKDYFSFFRATYYRWVEQSKEFETLLDSFSKVLSVGDLHIQNYGTWRDAEGRLVWGINDFDEASPLPWPNDLIRLMTSIIIAIKNLKIDFSAEEACKEIYEGYIKSLKQNGIPFVLEENHASLRNLAYDQSRDPIEFWENLQKSELVNAPIEIKNLIDEVLPKAFDIKIYHRQAGLGSLGRLRYVGIGVSDGSLIAREFKQLLPPLYEDTLPHNCYQEKIYRNGKNSKDPYLSFKLPWIVRRLSPHCCRINLEQIENQKLERKLFHSMGAETANIHLGDPNSQKILTELENIDPNKLFQLALTLNSKLEKDWEEWKEIE